MAYCQQHLQATLMQDGCPACTASPDAALRDALARVVARYLSIRTQQGVGAQFDVCMECGEYDRDLDMLLEQAGLVDATGDYATDAVRRVVEYMTERA